MNIAYIDYSIAQRSLDIFFAGCNNRCEDCCNPELQSFKAGADWKCWLPKIKFYLEYYGDLISNIFLVGGSPNHQSESDMKEFFEAVREFTDKPFWLFAGEELVTIKPIFKEYCDYIKVGAYIPSKKVDDYYQEGIKIATSNQRILRKGEY